MKKRLTIFILISFTTAVALIVGCATAKKSISDEVFFETWSGTWINTDNPGNAVEPQKIITYSDGTLDYYTTTEHSSSSLTVAFTLLEKWIDLNGNTWFKACKRCDEWEISIYEYGKIDSSGDTYELIYHIGSQKIDDWEPDNPQYNYVIYYRQ
jgi:hypothetical protein